MRLEMQSLLENIWQEHGFTALLSTHDVEEAVTLADYVVVMDQGNNTRFLPITPDIIKRQQEQADLFSRIKILPMKVDVKQKVLTSKDYAVLLPDSRFGLPDKARIATNSDAPPKTN